MQVIIEFLAFFHFNKIFSLEVAYYMPFFFVIKYISPSAKFFEHTLKYDMTLMKKLYLLS